MILTVSDEEYVVKYTEDPTEITDALAKASPEWITYDTETDGLHIKKARPFLGVVVWDGEAWVFPTTPEILMHLEDWASMTGRVYAHNTTYDMHMTANMTGDKMVLRIKNWGDTMGLCRLVFEAISTRDGGDSLKLKAISKKYIDPNADQYEKSIKAWMKAKASQDRKILIAMLRGVEWTMTRFETAMNKGIEPIPPEVMEVFNEWRVAYPEPTYKDVPMEIMLPYIVSDGIYTNILVRKSLPVIEARKQTHIMEKEFRLLRTVFKTERLGIATDQEYLKESAFRMENYIADLQAEMHELAGREFGVGQHKVIKDMYEEKLGERPASTDKQFMSAQEREGDELARRIKKLRTLEKWKSTYIDRILDITAYDGRFYTSLGQFNPVSGRFSGDAQQFPKDPVYTLAGDELKRAGKEVPESEVLYHPRRAFTGRTYYLDYSQVELRVQGHYTLPFGGDTNLCRAYMPFNCVHNSTGEPYDYTSFEGRKRWSDVRYGAPADHWEDQLKNGWSVWVVPETGKPWVPTDVHSSTTIKALVIMGMDPATMPEKDFKWWRSIGKRFNFMRNYGGGDKKAAETLEIALEAAKAMNKGYSDAFPLVVTYQGAVIQAFHKKGYVVTPAGRRYYLNDSFRFYKGANYLIQGWCADMLKDKIIEIDDYIEANNLSIALQLYVHDELQFHAPDPSEDHHIAKIKEIMEDLPQVLVPIVAEVELTETTWAAKKKVVT